MKQRQIKLLVIIASILVGAMLCGFVNPSETAEETAKKYIQAMTSQQYDIAYDMLADSIKKIASKEDFVELDNYKNGNIIVKDFEMSFVQEYDDKPLGEMRYNHVFEFNTTLTFTDSLASNKDRTGVYPIYVVIDNEQYKIHLYADIKEQLLRMYSNIGKASMIGRLEYRDPSKAIYALEKTLQYGNEKNPYVYDDLVTCYLERNMLDEAIAKAELAIRYNIFEYDKGKRMNTLGKIYELKNDIEAAKKQYREVLKMNQDNEYAKERMEKLGEFQIYSDKKYGAVSNITTIKFNDIPYKQASAVVSPNAKQVAYCKESNEFFIRELSTGETVAYPTKETIYQVKYSPDGTILIAGRNVLDIKSQIVTELATSAKISQAFDHLAFSPSSKNIAIYNEDLSDSSSGIIEIWDLQTKQQVKQLAIQEFFRNLDGKGSIIESMAYSPDGRYLVVAGRILTLWDIQEGKCVKVLVDDNKDQFSIHYGSVTYSPDGKHAAVVAGSKPSEEGEKSDVLIEIWDMGQGTVVKTLKVNSIYGLSQLKYSPDGQYLATGTAVGFGKGILASVLIWDANRGEVIRKLTEFPSGFISRIDFNMDGKILSASDHSSVRIWTFK
jgi:WD40 repeat protein